MNDRVVRLVYEAECFEHIRQRALSFRDRPTTGPGDDYFTALVDLKANAVSAGDELLANASWCLEQIGRVHGSFTSGFLRGKTEDYYGFWCTLEQVEITLSGLQRHLPLDGPLDFGLAFVDDHVPRFQSLFPYKVFLSPGMVVHSAECSICGQPVGIRKGCGHETGMIYNGEVCLRVIRDIELLETSFVTDPVQKYSIPFSKDIKYEYGPVRYLLQGLQSPWHGWDVMLSEVPGGGLRFPGTGRNAPCPCGSGEKYKRCCIREVPKKHHYEFAFERAPPASLPPYLDDGSFKVAGPPPGF